MKTISAERVFGLALVVVMSACATSHVLTQGEVGRSGARHFTAPKDTMFAVCVGALTAEGYEIASSDPATGVIVTRPMAVREPGEVTAHAYRVTVSQDGDGSRVVAQPILYDGTRDVSNGSVWVLDGPEGERARWSDLFGVMDTAMVTPAPAAGRQEAVAVNGKAATPALAKEPAAPATAKTGPSSAGGLTPAGLTAGAARP